MYMERERKKKQKKPQEKKHADEEPQFESGL
jgi:hypothetical protein